MEADLAKTRPVDARAQDDFRVLIGWAHAPCHGGIQLKVQPAVSVPSRRQDIAEHSYLMTRNQALILARYLLEVTGQTLPEPSPQGKLRRLVRRITGG